MPETTKHTPGPWRADWVNVYRKDDHLADCCPKAKNGIPLEQKEANARLIAAAPELLAALKALVNMQKGHENWPEVKQAEAAIAKATQG